MTPMKLEPVALRFRVKHSTTELLAPMGSISGTRCNQNISHPFNKFTDCSDLVTKEVLVPYL